MTGPVIAGPVISSAAFVGEWLDRAVAASIEFLISKSGDQTQVQIQTTRDEGAISMHGAEKAMDIILQAMHEQPTLAQGSTAGW